MAEILPFQALRYDAARYPIANLVTQPYDKITPEMQRRYYGASPYNLVRIILGEQMSGDNDRQNVYTRAAGYLKTWRTEKVLLPDPKPSIYAYTQAFTAPGSSAPVHTRKGFIALGKICEYSEGVVFRHEQTLSKPKSDRLNLLRATAAHFGQIFMLYNDPASEVERLLEQSRAADVSVRDEYGVQHCLWPVSDQETLAKVRRAMADKKLIIADGHHRYETALNYRNERRAAHANQPAPWDYVMMTFINMASPSLVILPTHRVVAGLSTFNEQGFYQAAKKYFSAEELASGLPDAELTQKLREAGKNNVALLAATKNAVWLLRGLPAAQQALAALPERQRQLDVIQLHKLLLEGALGMSEESIRNQEHIRYLRDTSEALQQVRSGSANIAFLMNPVRIEQMRDVAFAGEVMPQKSTDFYPKLLSGLTIYALE
ncbi:MAG TPA: DUF1015 domain-containing protein [Terriglobales bacterium]|nr:DUF1015 domain-containing protein [Terriglobales bacterium]